MIDEFNVHRSNPPTIGRRESVRIAMLDHTAVTRDDDGLCLVLRGDALQRIGDAVERRDRLAAGNRHLVGSVPIEVAVTLRDLVVGHPVGLAGMMLTKVGILDHLEIAENRTEYLGGLSGPRQARCVERATVPSSCVRAQRSRSAST